MLAPKSELVGGWGMTESWWPCVLQEMGCGDEVTAGAVGQGRPSSWAFCQKGRREVCSQKKKTKKKKRKKNSLSDSAQFSRSFVSDSF